MDFMAFGHSSPLSVLSEVFEAAAKIAAHKLRYFLDTWNVVDFFLMLVAVVDSVTKRQLLESVGTLA